MGVNWKIWLFIGIASIFMVMAFSAPAWGFFGHRYINRMAVFTLPSEMIGPFKKNIEYLTEHAVDPDKRRYATKFEAIRHYIDLDVYGSLPFDDVPRRWGDALAQNLIFACIQDEDTTIIYKPKKEFWGGVDLWKDSIYSSLLDFTYLHVLPNFYEDEWVFDADTIKNYVLSSEIKRIRCDQVHVYEQFSQHGILPYHLAYMQKRLTDDFKRRDLSRVLRTAAELGHYIGDAHVPLHTTENYNGQLTGQEGIHGFWESRVPELFANDNYEFWVGQAQYINDPVNYYWDIVLKSHSYVEEVLGNELELRKTFPTDQQYCFEERLGRTIRTQCADFAAAYQESLDGMVEDRMVASVAALGNAWYTAWVDAGQPDLEPIVKEIVLTEEEKKELRDLDTKFESGDIKGRSHN